MKAREIREMLHGHIEPKAIIAICALAESLSAQKQEIKMLAEASDKLTDILMQLGTVVEGATNAVDELKKQRMDGWTSGEKTNV